MQPANDGAPDRPPLWRSFGHAWNGLVDAAITQRNMRIHLVAGVLACAFAASAPLAATERAAILLCAALVVAAEAANTALEALVDLHGGPPSEPGRIAKDAAAGAVLALAAASVLVLAVVLLGHRSDPWSRWREAIPGGVAGLGLGTTALALVLPRGPPHATAALIAAGVILITVLALTSASPPCAAASGALLAVAAAARRRGRGHGQPVDSQPRRVY